MTKALAAPPGGRSAAAPAVPAQFTASALAAPPAPGMAPQFSRWWRDRHASGRFEVETIPFAELEKWHFDGGTGNLAHNSGRFFTVEGLRVTDGGDAVRTQPILNQPEIGVLGVLAREFDGVLHFLVQAKMEPGNVNTIQLSPTVQATRSNYSRVHRGAHTRYLEHFLGSSRGEVLVDALQSEQGAWFLHKRNRNMVVRVTEDVPEHEDFRWLTLRQIRDLFTVDNLVSMDLRTVLACMPHEPPPPAAAADAFTAALLRSYAPGGARHSAEDVLSWFTEMKTECQWRVGLIPLNRVGGWHRTADEITDAEHRDFRIVAARVAATNREVGSWTQPLLAPRGRGTAVFLARPIGGVLHLLVQAQPQPGLRDLVELAPTVHVPPGEDPALTAARPYAAEAATEDPALVRFDTVLSEEGGRFYHALTRYRVVEAPPDLPAETPPTHRWLTVHQLQELVRHGYYLNIEARSLLACLHGLW